MTLANGTPAMKYMTQKLTAMMPISTANSPSTLLRSSRACCVNLPLNGCVDPLNGGKAPPGSDAVGGSKGLKRTQDAVAGPT